MAPLQGVPIKFADVFRFEADVEGIGCFKLHTIGEFEALEARLKIGIRVPLLGVFFVQVAEEIQLIALPLSGQVGWGDMINEFSRVGCLGIDVGSLVGRGKESGLPVLSAGDGVSAGAHCHESGEILVFGS